MSLFNAVFQGPPTLANQSAGSTLAPNLGIDTINVVEYANVGNGWQIVPGGVTNKSVFLAQSANNANLLTFTAPQMGIYEIIMYEVSTDTPTGATLPGLSVTYTDADTGNSTTLTSPTLTAVSTMNAVNNGDIYINSKVGTTITVANTGYAAGSGTALTYNVKVRVTYMA